jgi:alpha-tubulin suppressor-like RCC1 family protein
MARRHRLTIAVLVTGIVAGLSGCSTTSSDAGLPRDLRAVAVGDRHSCALTPQGAAWCWGSNRYGQLGVGDTEEGLQARPVQGDITFTSLSAGKSHTCGIDVDDMIWCWGGNFVGQLGTGDEPGGTSTRPHRVIGFSGRAVEVSAGSSATCATNTDGEAWCWGENLLDQLGVAGLDGPTRPPTKLPLEGVRSSALYLAATCLAGESIHCHGRNFTRGAAPGEYPGTSVDGPATEFVKIASSNNKTCAIDRDAMLHCFYSLPYRIGENGDKQPGYWTPADQVSARPVTGIAGAHATFCAIYEEEEIICDGFRPPTSHFLSEETLTFNALEQYADPWTVEGPTGRLTSISGGTAHFCAGNDTGQLWCWGWNENGQLGTGDRNNRIEATPIN